MRAYRALILLAAAMFALAPHTAIAAGVVVTIKPLHSIASAVMQGAGSPYLLVSGAASPHAFALKPSDAAALKAADLIVWVGPQLETALERAIATLAKPRAVMTLIDLPGLGLVEAREGGVWTEHGHEKHAQGGKLAADGSKNEDHHGKGEHHVDPHIWLDPGNAAVISTALAETLSRLDPANAGLYRRNAGTLGEKLKSLDRELEQKVLPLRGKPYVVFHDAYRYFEDRYGLEAAGSITISPDRQPGARRISEIRSMVAARKAICVFAEPQFEPKLQKRLVEATGAKAGVLDPLGAALPEGPDLYFSLMRGLADGLAACLLP